MRYAQNTAVSSEKSKSEIEDTIRRYGAEKFMQGWSGDKAVIQFQMNGKMIRFTLPLPNRDDFKTKIDGRSDCAREQSPERAYADWEQACRQRWRALALAIKAKLEAVECGITTFESEFMAHIVIPGMKGQTMADIYLPRIDEAYATGKAPALAWEEK